MEHAAHRIVAGGTLARAFLLFAAAPRRHVHHFFVVVDEDADGFDLAQPRPQPFVHLGGQHLRVRLRVLHRLDQLGAIAGEPSVGHAAVGHDAADVTVAQLGLEQRERRRLRALESAGDKCASSKTTTKIRRAAASGGALARAAGEAVRRAAQRFVPPVRAGDAEIDLLDGIRFAVLPQLEVVERQIADEACRSCRE